MKPQDHEVWTVPPDGGAPSEQPRWRQDFPIDWPQDDDITRRDLVKFMVLTSLAFVVGQFWIVLRSFFRARRANSPTQEVAKVDEVPVGGVVRFHYPDAHTPCLLMRLDEAAWVAYDQQCTHLSCPVIPRPEAGQLHCPCHEGAFDLTTGRPIAGPPRRPLRRVRLKVRDDRIYAVALEEKTV